MASGVFFIRELNLVAETTTSDIGGEMSVSAVEVLLNA
jgi:hypothetical protein